MARVKMTAKEKRDNKELFEALRFMEQEKGVPCEFIADKIAENEGVCQRIKLLQYAACHHRQSKPPESSGDIALGHI